MGIAKHPSVVTLPPAGNPYPSIAEFLHRTFPTISLEQWQRRIRDGKVQTDQGKPISLDTAYVPATRLFYFREVDHEPHIPFPELILYQDDEILVADKPHFLPVIPGGRFVNECLLYRLQHRTGLSELAPLHRIDRETAGVVIFSVNRKNRSEYAKLFSGQTMKKTYHAVVSMNAAIPEQEWMVENRLERGTPRFRMQVVPGPVNARSRIRFLEWRDQKGLFELQPMTGKTHQLRVHMSALGYGILHDRVYPELRDARDDNFEQPLQLLAKQIEFQDPVTQQSRLFQSQLKLSW